MVKRIFSYSDQVSKQHGNNLKRMHAFVLTIIFSITFLIMITMPDMLFLGIVAVFIMVIVLLYWFYLLYKFHVHYRHATRSYVITEDNKIYQIAPKKSSTIMVIGGQDAPDFYRQFTNQGSEFEDILINSAGKVEAGYLMKRNKDFMANYDFVNYLFNNIQTLEKVNVICFTKVTMIKEQKSCYKIKCDYQDLINDRIVKGKTITIEKSYCNYEELIQYFEKLTIN